MYKIQIVKNKKQVNLIIREENVDKDWYILKLWENSVKALNGISQKDPELAKLAKEELERRHKINK